MLFFFFSSRRRHTIFKCDWSSDVCSSDLAARLVQRAIDSALVAAFDRALDEARGVRGLILDLRNTPSGRSEERRVGKERRSRWSPYHYKKKVRSAAKGC